jgi:general secretion pathway protein A
LQIVLTGQPELRDVINSPDLRQLKQRVSLRCEIKPLPNIEETERYISSRLLVAGAERTDIFSPGAIDYIFRCSEGIPRNINNLCDNALLVGFAAGAETIPRSIVEEVAETFDMLPRSDTVRQSAEEREAPARIFSAAGRAELWAAGTGAGSSSGGEESTPSPLAMREEVEETKKSTPDTDEVGAAFRRSGLLGGI